ncbi:MAG: hypothetical protein HYY01_00830 [Chloroflexi bacterium]|nr:hypothetical protein [Chloroflexota bacterium]
MWGGILAGAMLALSGLVIGMALGLSGLTGAIFTTDATGLVVNGNIYQNKCDVYLNGGPGPNAPPGAASLPNGQYYYQVTDPSGQTLLAGPGAPSGIPDTASKVITVAGGIFSLVQLCLYLDTPNQGGEYKAWVTAVGDFAPGNGFHGFIPSKSKTDNFKVRAGGGPEVHPLLELGKFYDANVSGILDGGDTLLTGWQEVVIDPLGVQMPYYTPAVVPLSTPGQYTVEELMPLGSWVQTSLRVDNSYQNSALPSTTPKDATFQLSNQSHSVLFGNVCLGAGGGKTLGFWSNKNGQAAMAGIPGALSNLSALNLKDGAGNDFDPASYDAFKTWLLSANATNMAYMLSAQLAAMSLNLQAGYVSWSAQVWTGSVFMSVSDLVTAANNALGADGLTLAGDPNRANQEYLKNALDRANNNLSFVQAQPCPIRY